MCLKVCLRVFLGLGERLRHLMSPRVASNLCGEENNLELFGLPASADVGHVAPGLTKFLKKMLIKNFFCAGW